MKEDQMDEEMMKALEEDGEKMRALTGRDHGPVFLIDAECCGLLDLMMCGACPHRTPR
jgi:hypothetical protein